MPTLIKADKQIKGATAAIFGITFKENCPDVRNTKVIDVINELKEYGVNVVVTDPVADEKDLLSLYGIKLEDINDIKDVDAAVFAVPHEEFKSIELEDIKKIYNQRWNGYSDAADEAAAAADGYTYDKKYVLADIKGIFDKKIAENMGFLYWRL